jgi:hypothetical protein
MACSDTKITNLGFDYGNHKNIKNCFGVLTNNVLYIVTDANIRLDINIICFNDYSHKIQ